MSERHHLHDYKWYYVSWSRHSDSIHRREPIRLPSPLFQHALFPSGVPPSTLTPLSLLTLAGGRLAARSITRFPKRASTPHSWRRGLLAYVTVSRTERKGLLLLRASSLHSPINAAAPYRLQRRRRRLSGRPTRPPDQPTAFRRASLRSPMLAPTSVSAGDPSL